MFLFHFFLAGLSSSLSIWKDDTTCHTAFVLMMLIYDKIYNLSDGSDDSSIKKQNNRKNPDSNDNTNAVMESHIHQVQVHLEEEEIL
ncbi:hypothetical protein BDB00DRAFT_842074 [Zychaea mexicana]|uniref:uncharacterized protein n=1 Tax=Zychaea mexicana TaxID=64656 RepID=UPI0022FE61A5|nr:uncharacterized protein BDB00DRAFT_842074 [Zychaea mexicana]KAI9489696.1 hypothetical protein BDB00DRAFT_842074 [Zychaea mexicana]